MNDTIRSDFPILLKNLVYFDNACMSLKPVQVVDAMREYYEEYTACAGRSSHHLSKKVEEEVDKSRLELRKLINAKKSEEIVFTRNTTEGINLVANSLGLKKGDEVVLSDKEHNSNLVPWLKLAKAGVSVKIVDSNPDNTFNLERLGEAVSEKTKIVSVVHTSNLDGVTNPLREIAKIAHVHGAKIMADGAQSVPGQEVDVRRLGVDFLSFSGHKMLGPTGTGVLYGKKSALEELDQFIVGGETVVDSTYESFVPEEIPMKFEAGLQDYASAIGLRAASNYLRKIGLRKVHKHEERLNAIITEGLDSVQVIGPHDAALRGGVFSFTVEGMDPHHVSKMLDALHILTRSGAHCVHSWFNKHDIKGSVRASVYLYNTEEEAQRFVEEVKKIAAL